MPRALPTAGAARQGNMRGAARSLGSGKTSGQSVVSHCRQSCKVWSKSVLESLWLGWIPWRDTWDGVMQTLRHTGEELFRKGVMRRLHHWNLRDSGCVMMGERILQGIKCHRAPGCSCRSQAGRLGRSGEPHCSQSWLQLSRASPVMLICRHRGA